MRLYYGRLLQHMGFNTFGAERDAMFRLRIDRMIYEANTIEGVLSKVKADGHQIWGKELLDYARPPDTAYELLLVTAYMKSQGYDQSQINEWVGIDAAHASESGKTR